jgi:hypothetical protein
MARLMRHLRPDICHGRNLIRSPHQPSPICYSAGGLCCARLPPLAGLALYTTCSTSDGVTTEFACCLRGFRRYSGRRSDALVTLKSFHRTTAVSVSAHCARDDLHLRSKVQIQIIAFRGHGGHAQQSEDHCTFDRPQAALNPASRCEQRLRVYFKV